MLLIEAWVYALLKELQNHKGKALIVFALVTAIVVAIGFAWPKRFEASSVIFADEQNIIRPLLSGSAEVTRPDADQSSLVRERVMSNSIVAQALVDAKWVKSASDPAALDPLIKRVRSRIKVTPIGGGHIRIAYSAEDANESFVMVSALTDVFIRDSANTKRAESREAFTFIDNQVKTYKEQLQQSEDRLKDFKTESGVVTGNFDQIGRLHTDISKLTLDLQVARARREELQRQISQVKQSAGRDQRADAYRQRLAQSRSQLDSLRLSYSDTYPDIVSLKQQIQDLERAIADVENHAVASSDSSDQSANPVYTKLRGDLADAEVNLRTLELQLASAKQMLGSEESHSRKGAEYDAQLAELTRDYDVTKQMYERMLERKERARLSVALDVEGQGVTFKIKEPPVFPQSPLGLRFLHFFLGAPILGVLVPLGILGAYVYVDPRIRFASDVASILPAGVQLLAVVPHMSSRSERALNRGNWTVVAIGFVAVLVIYVAVGLLRIVGVL